MNEGFLHYITITVVDWIDIFIEPKYFDIIIESFKYCQKNKGLNLYEFVVMKNHLHFIASVKYGYKLSSVISDFKRYTTNELLKLLRKDNKKIIIEKLKQSSDIKKGYKLQIWKRENCPKLIETEEFLLNKVKYIYDNPVKKGYVERSEDWKYGSARNRYLNDNKLIIVDDLVW